MSSNPASKRNYRKEYDSYQGKPEQIKKRAERTQARRDYEKAHGDLPSNIDIDHKRPVRNGGTSAASNLRAVPESRNSAWRKGSKGYKVKPV